MTQARASNKAPKHAQTQNGPHERHADRTETAPLLGPCIGRDERIRNGRENRKFTRMRPAERPAHTHPKGPNTRRLPGTRGGTAAAATVAAAETAAPPQMPWRKILHPWA